MVGISGELSVGYICTATCIEKELVSCLATTTHNDVDKVDCQSGVSK